MVARRLPQEDEVMEAVVALAITLSLVTGLMALLGFFDKKGRR